MSPEQKVALKAAILADPVLGPLTSGPQSDYWHITNAMNAEASPVFYVWRTSYSPQQMRAAMTTNLGTAQLDGLSAGKRDALLWFIGDTLNPSDPATVATLNDFCGTQNTLKASLVDGGKRKALRVEKLFATGTGTLVSPALLTFEGTVQFNEIAEMFNV